MNGPALIGGGAVLALGAWWLSRRAGAPPVGDVLLGQVTVSKASVTSRDQERAKLYSASAAIQRALGLNEDTGDLEPTNAGTLGYQQTIDVAESIADELDAFGKTETDRPVDDRTNARVLRALISDAKKLGVAQS